MSLRLRLMVTVALIGVAATLGGAGHAQTAPANPNSDQILKALTPTQGVGGPSRGIRLANPPPAGSATTAAPPAATHTAATASSSTAAPSVNLNVQFQNGSAVLTSQAMQTLNELGRALSQPALASYRFRIAGHTDTVGTEDRNKELSDRRAAAVADYLATNFKVDRSRLEPVGMGEQGLLVPTPAQTPEPRNRRVEVINIGT